MSGRKLAFVVMPISETHPELEDVLHGIKRICDKKSIQAVRADEVEHSGRITDVVLRLIQSASFLIADLSLERPNVYYELGFAHGLGKSVILVAKEGQELPFDVKDYNAIFYRNITDLEMRLENRIELYARDHSLIPTNLAKCIAKPSLEDIRKLTNAMPLETLEENIEIGRIPNGRYGYTEPWMLDTNGSAVVGGTGVQKIFLEPMKGGTAVMEIHKDTNGVIYVVGFVNERFKSSALKCDGNTEFTGIMAFSWQRDFPQAIAISVDRIVSYSHRTVSKYGEIADMTIM